jgi:hypothetical protein
LAGNMTLSLPQLKGVGLLEGEAVSVNPDMSWVPVIGWAEQPGDRAGVRLLVEPVAAIVATPGGTRRVPIRRSTAYPEPAAPGNPGAGLDSAERLALVRAVCGPTGEAVARVTLQRLEVRDDGRVTASPVGLLVLRPRPVFVRDGNHDHS